MAVPSTFADLSTTPASNSGLISDSSAVNVIDDHARTIYALIASIYANSGNGWASPYLPAANPVYTGTLTGGTGVVNLGSGQFYKDASGNVGIGTATPAVKLDVIGAGDGGLQYRTGTRTVGIGQTASEASVYWGSTTPLTFFSGSERMRIDSSGNVGVGVTPTTKLDIFNSANNYVYVRSSATSASGIELAGNGNTAGTTSFGLLQDSLSNAYVFQRANALLAFGTNNTERMRIDSSGNQINTPSNTPPTLTVNGQMNLTPTSDTNMRISYRGSDGVTRVANITLA